VMFSGRQVHPETYHHFLVLLELWNGQICNRKKLWPIPPLSLGPNTEFIRELNQTLIVLFIFLAGFFFKSIADFFSTFNWGHETLEIISWTIFWFSRKFSIISIFDHFDFRSFRFSIISIFDQFDFR